MAFWYNDALGHLKGSIISLLNPVEACYNIAMVRPQGNGRQQTDDGILQGISGDPVDGRMNSGRKILHAI